MYARALVVALVRTGQVTADLLVVTVMGVSFLAAQPMGGALVAWFISMGLAILFAIIERTRRKIEALSKEKSKSVRIVRDGKILVLPSNRSARGTWPLFLRER